MTKRLILIAAFLASAACQAHDSWTTEDKRAHFALMAGVAAAGTTVAQGNEWAGFGAAVLLGAAKEGYDAFHRPKHDPSWKDFGADVAGAYVGAKVGGLIIMPKGHGFTLSLVRKF